MLLVKNELDALGDSPSWNGDLWKHWKVYYWKKMNPKEMTLRSLRILVEKYQYRNPAGTNIIRVYFLIEKGVVLEDPSKQLNMRGLTGWDNRFRGNHINHITAGIGNSWSDFTLQWMLVLWKRETLHIITHNGHIWCTEIFAIMGHLFEPWATANICTAEQKLSMHRSCATNHAWLRKGCLLIREACTHYSPVSSAGATRFRNVLYCSLDDKKGGRWGRREGGRYVSSRLA